MIKLFFKVYDMWVSLNDIIIMKNFVRVKLFNTTIINTISFYKNYSIMKSLYLGIIFISKYGKIMLNMGKRL